MHYNLSVLAMLELRIHLAQYGKPLRLLPPVDFMNIDAEIFQFSVYAVNSKMAPKLLAPVPPGSKPSQQLGNASSGQDQMYHLKFLLSAFITVAVW